MTQAVDQGDVVGGVGWRKGKAIFTWGQMEDCTEVDGGSNDDGGLDDLQQLYRGERTREKHSRSHAQGAARAMAIAKRNGRRAAGRGGS